MHMVVELDPVAKIPPLTFVSDVIMVIKTKLKLPKIVRMPATAKIAKTHKKYQNWIKTWPI